MTEAEFHDELDLLALPIVLGIYRGDVIDPRDYETTEEPR